MRLASYKLVDGINVSEIYNPSVKQCVQVGVKQWGINISEIFAIFRPGKPNGRLLPEMRSSYCMFY